MLKYFLFKGLVNYLEQENFKTLVTQIEMYIFLRTKKLQSFFRKAKQIAKVVCLNSIKYK